MSKKYTFTWNVQPVERMLISVLTANMWKAVAFAEAQCKLKMTGSSSKTETVISKSGRSRSQKKAKVIRSKHGQYPHVETGILKNNISHYVARRKNKVIGYLGVRLSAATAPIYSGDNNGGYAFALEYGTSKMKARPYLRPTVLNNRRQLSRIVGGGK